MEGRCYEKNNLWSGNDIIYYCILCISVIVLCFVCCEYRVRVSRKTAKMLDESGVDVAGESSSGEQPAPEITLSELMRVLTKQISESSERHASQIAESSKNLKLELMNQISESSERHARQISESNKRHEERFDRLDSCLVDQAAKLENLEAKFDHKIGTLQNQLEGRCGKIETSVENLGQELESSRAEARENIIKIESEISQKLQACDRKVEAYCESITENIAEVKTEMNGKFTKIETKLSTEVSEIHGKFEKLGVIEGANIRDREEKLKKEIDKNLIKLVREEIEKEKENGPIANSSGGSGLRFSWAPPQNLCFWGKADENPKVFLDRAENYMDLTKAVPSKLKPKFMQELLRGNAAHWLTALAPFPQTYEEFRTKFLARYWNEQTRYEFERKILENRWDKRRDQSYLDYAMEKISAIKLCDPMIEDKKVIWLLTAHYPTYVQNLINSVGCEDLDRFQELLAQFDRTRVISYEDNWERNQGNGQNRPSWRRDDRNRGNAANERRPPPDSNENRGGNAGDRNGQHDSTRQSPLN